MYRLLVPPRQETFATSFQKYAIQVSGSLPRAHSVSGDEVELYLAPRVQLRLEEMRPRRSVPRELGVKGRMGCRRGPNE